ncbi:replication initiator protein A (plasmid) [Lacticaseibacillus paracasei]|uniref:replication initiator protein A n=1 Tax=Lacticaseibacillus paracasei TaxID=1597 RepID=UPI0021AE51A3|nr:replication initiator protein A [Lacticaseibacillus paracasei]UWY26084.1 replication initiator protein A [Lacticaseibacillus paracasei]
MNKKAFNFYQSNSVFRSLYFQFPKILFYGKQYQSLSLQAKAAYMVLKDRLEYSLKNNWIDESNHVYFIYTIQELTNLFNCSKPTAIKMKRELEKAGLLYQQAMHFNPKTGRNEPNRLYLAELEVSATDVYSHDRSTPKNAQFPDNDEGKNILPSRSTVKSVDTSEGKDSLLSQKSTGTHSQTLGKSEGKDSLHDLYKNLDINIRDNTETEKLDFSSSQYSREIIQRQNQDLVQNAKDYLPEATTGGLFLNREGVELLGLWCRTPKQMHRFLGIILNAKKAVEKEHEEISIVLDDPCCQDMINKTMRRFFNILRSDSKKINNVENYLFGAMKETLLAYWNKSLITTKDSDLNEF